MTTLAERAILSRDKAEDDKEKERLALIEEKRPGKERVALERYERWLGSVPDKIYSDEHGRVVLVKDGINLVYGPAYTHYFFGESVDVRECFRYAPICDVCGYMIVFPNFYINSLEDLGNAISRLPTRCPDCNPVSRAGILQYIRRLIS
jgi:hypothetical protein